MILCLILMTMIVLAYAAAVHHNGYWRRRGVAGPPPRPFVGNMNEWFRRVPLSLQLYKWTKQYGKVYGVQEGWMNVFVTSDVRLLHDMFTNKFELFHKRKLPATVGDVDAQARISVFKAHGSRWKRLRAVSSPLLSVANIKRAMPILHDSIRVMMLHLENKSAGDNIIDISDHLHEFSTDVIMRVAMGQRESRQFESVERTRVISNTFTASGRHNLHYYGRIVQPWLSNTVHRLSKQLKSNSKAPFASLMNLIEAAIDERKSQKEKQERQIDFIDLFLNAKDDIMLERSSEKVFTKSAVKKKLTAAEISAQCFVFLLAGSDTMANLMAATCHYLARSEDVQCRLREEIINENCDTDEPTYEEINKLEYLNAVIRETLRLCPLASASCSRQCSKTTTLGQYTIEEGTYVQADVFAIHRDREVWGEDADEFRPDRWLEEGAAERASLSWMPFGAGPRLCVGMRLAYLEEKLALVRLLRTYDIYREDESDNGINLQGNAVLNPGPVFVRLRMINTNEQQ